VGQLGVSKWGSWLKADNVYTAPNFRLLYIFFKGTPTKAGGTTTIAKPEFLEWTRGRWQIQWQKHDGHPAPFPIALPMRCLKLFGHEGDIVLDPFIGSGTTAIACIRTKRNYIGMEISETYVTLARERIENELRQLEFDF
jgi:site-specific DNA-methyltransferase (adenine-specific)